MTQEQTMWGIKDETQYILLKGKTMNGDRIDFEIEHKDTPLKERPDYPYCALDAKDWAEEFCRINPNTVALDVVQVWFASALMRGMDEGVKAQLTTKGEA